MPSKLYFNSLVNPNANLLWSHGRPRDFRIFIIFVVVLFAVIFRGVNGDRHGTRPAWHSTIGVGFEVIDTLSCDYWNWTGALNALIRSKSAWNVLKVTHMNRQVVIEFTSIQGWRFSFLVFYVRPRVRFVEGRIGNFWTISVSKVLTHRPWC